jgi:hypothetical protein
MAVGRISGQLLKDNLIRSTLPVGEQNIAFETDLLYIDIINSRIGIKTANPQYPLDVNGTTRTVNLEVTNTANISDLTLTGTSITTTNPVLSIASPDKILYNNAIVVDDFQISNNLIEITTLNTDLQISPNGTGIVDILSDVEVTGNIYATGNITADGNITLGDQDTDNVTINADINSDLIPEVWQLTDPEVIAGTYAAGDPRYDLGTGAKRWNEMFVSDLTVDNLTVGGNILVGGLDLTQTPGNIIYVATNGDNANTGTHQNDPVLTIQQAITLATAGDLIHIYPGTYTETFPITVPVGVTIKGESLRSVLIQPTGGTIDQNAFILNGETTIEDLTVGNFRFNAGLNRGYAFRYAASFTVTTRSPYIKNVSVITAGSVTSGSDPRGFNTGDAGKGAYLDGSLATAGSNEASCLFQNCTFITPGVDAITMTNGVRVEWLNSFTYFANRSLYAVDGVTGLKGTGKTLLKVTGLSGPAVIAGQTITYYDVDNTTVLGTGTIATVDSTKFYLTGKVTGFENAVDRLPKIFTVNGDAQLSTAEFKYGTASLLLDGTGDYLSITTNPDFGYGSGNFTIEFWLRRTSVGNQVIIEQRSATALNNPMIHIDGGVIKYYAAAANRITGTTTIAINTWYHVAVSRNSGVTKLFVNGTQEGSTYSDANNHGVTSTVIVGADYLYANALPGYLDDLRITKAALYTSNFTAPVAELVNTPNTKLLLNFNGTNGSTTITDTVVGAQYISFSGGAIANSFSNVDYTDFGAEVRSIASASVYGNYGAYGDGEGVLMYLVGHNFAYIGNGKEVDNDASTAIQANEVVELSNARIFYSSVDHEGNFRVGNLFTVDQDTGAVSFTAASTVLSSATALTFISGGNTTVIDGTLIQQNNVRLSGNTIESTSGALNLDADNGQINLLDNVSITGDLDVTGDVSIGGNITIGDQTTDTLSIVAAITSDIIPQTTNTYNLGSAAKNWNTVYSSTINVDGNIRIENNLITTQTTNSNLQLSGAGTGSVEIENFRINDNTITNTTGDMTFTPATGVTVFTGTGSVRLPAGGDAARPAIPTAGMIRYNTDSNLFEGYDGSWTVLQGVYDLDRNTYITPELTPGANDNTIRFYSNSALVADVNSTRFDVNTLQVDSITISGNTLTTTGVNQDLILNANGTGIIRIENLNFQTNTITNYVTDAPIIFETTGNGYVDLSQAGGVRIPYGLSAQKPTAPVIGLMRYNQDDLYVEIYDGANWVSVAGSGGAVTLTQAEQFAVEYALTLG